MLHSFATNLCLSVVSDDVEIKQRNMPPNPLPTVNSESHPISQTLALHSFVAQVYTICCARTQHVLEEFPLTKRLRWTTFCRPNASDRL